MKDPQLLPCPFCGGSNVEVYFVTGCAFDWWAGCSDCRIRVKTRADSPNVADPARQEAINGWNRRASLSGEREALDAAWFRDVIHEARVSDPSAGIAGAETDDELAEALAEYVAEQLRATPPTTDEEE